MRLSPGMCTRTSTVLAVVGAALAVGGGTAVAAPLAPGAPVSRDYFPGATSLGDSLFPALGNGGYDAEHYDFNLRFGDAPADPVTGQITMLARATKPLTSFTLDFAGTAVGNVKVNGLPAASQRVGEKLRIVPKRPLLPWLPFVVSIGGFVASPDPFDGEPTSVDFFSTPGGTATAGQPAYAHYAFPLNDHPRDKASYTFRLDAPASETAVANGARVDKRTTKGRTTWTYLQRQPMASELIQIAVGDYRVIDRGVHDGVALRDVIAGTAPPELSGQLASVTGQMDYMQSHLGRYPFDTYGTLVTEDAGLGFALETQTLSLFDTHHFAGRPESDWGPVMVHELSHQWFGDSVSPSDWADIWINEGHATWYELHYADDRDFLEDYVGNPSLEDLFHVIYSEGDQFRAEFGPVGKPLSGDDADIFSPQSYYGGVLVLYALQQEIGDAAFDRFERAYVTKFKGTSAGTADLIKLASKVADRDLAPFLTDWIYGTTTPPMPGHPDWAVDPVEAAAPAARSLAAGAPPASPLRRLPSQR